MRLVWVSLPHATYGLLISDGRVVEAPPIARWAIGKNERTVAQYLLRKGAKTVVMDR